MEKIKFFKIIVLLFLIFVNKTQGENLVDSDDYYKNIFPKEINKSNFGLYKGTLLNLKAESKDYVIVNNKAVFGLLVICIYEKETGTFLDLYARKWVFLITDQYGESKVDFIDLLGDGSKFIHILFEGNTGTGTMQMLDMYAGWDNFENKFKPVFLENKKYYLGMGDDYSQMTAVKEINNSGTKKISIKLVSSQKIARQGKKDVRYKWSETFRWNEGNFSFYDEGVEKSKFNNPLSPVQKTMAETRLLFLEKRPNLEDLSTNVLNEIKIMDCMQNSRPNDSDNSGPDEK